MTDTVDWMRVCRDIESRCGRPAKAVIGTDDLMSLVEDLSAAANAYVNGGHVEDCAFLPVATNVRVEGTEDGWRQVGHPHMHKGVDCDEPHDCDCGLNERIDKVRDVLRRRPEIWEQL